ncbi:MAG: glycoside hydrolase family 16 protein, partial [Candidatus Eremiobacteraeota bacterium]|nr:glycoside hydrolase family 16 protein [Candidatus Eremiobacteraeota bacterium]
MQGLRYMPRLLKVLVLLSLALSSYKPAPAQPPTRKPPSEWKMTWHDEFNGPDGSAPDPDHWTYAVGGNGFGNHELQTYTNRPENVVVEDGDLVITAREEDYTGPDGIPRDYTSGRLYTREHFTQRYGRFEARIKVPEGQGMWPAFWMLGANRH